MVRIALDAMGGDRAPAETVAGAVDAASDGVDVVLVGDQRTIVVELAKHDVSLPVVDAPDVIGMGDDPSSALREKPEASIPVSAKLVREGSVDGFVSAGSTGAATAAAAILVGRIKGVSRPAIATTFPTPITPTMVLDSGANPEVTPEQLHQFGIMGSVACETLLGVDSPRVGLLSIGEEKGKGRDLEREAYELLDRAAVNFVGNIEGRDLAVDKVDVAVTDGFTGNVLLKTAEGIARMVAGLTLEAISELDPETQEAVFPALMSLRKRIDWETYGGAQLLGIRSNVLIAHGSSSRVAIKNVLTMAKESAEKGLPERVSAQLT